MRHATLFVLFIALFVIFSTVGVHAIPATSREYLDEFSDEGEECFLEGEYTYFTLDSVERKVAIFNCQNSLLIPFDFLNRQTLTLEQASSLFESKFLEEKLKNGEINKETYDYDIFNESSDTFFCSLFGYQELVQETANVASQITEKEILEHLPGDSKAYAIVSGTVITGKKLGLIKNANYGSLAIAAICTGSKVYNSWAISYLKTCQTYLVEIDQGKTYEGEVDDLESCHMNSINRIDKLNFSFAKSLVFTLNIS